ncbi:hypothetical protein [Aliidiomarina indica]|uniref:hypothetical protein n=1 Tax=Aliidiomarina indica TaxID=2749147 RepID=UPI0018909FD4|nr:hypothetical protein [Aliidiomarina indica]
MSQSQDNKGEISIDDDLIAAAEAALEELPKTVDEMIERWVYLGKAAANQLTEEEQLLLMVGSGRIVIKDANGNG